jgi:hypothetical protein
MKPDKEQDLVRQNLCKQFRPKDENDFRELFFKWLSQFHNKYLLSERVRKDEKTGKERGNITPLQWKLFHVQHNNFDERINPDIGGSLTKSVMDA